VKSVDPTRVCLLATVYLPYRWMAEITADLIELHWPEHPPLFFCGLKDEEAGDLPILPLRSEGGPRIWASFALDAARELAARGFELCYFLLEDQPPLARCNHKHLMETLPSLINSLPASYIGLMGWDNRRFNYGSPILPPSHFRLMHHVDPGTPRFHLHTSLFRMDTLVRCLKATAASAQPTPWGFEKLCDKADAPLPAEDKNSCYQICGEELYENRPSAWNRAARAAERWFYHRAMSLYQPLARVGLGKLFWETMGYENVFFDGPYPMFYAGVMSRGGVNRHLVRYLQKRNPELLQKIREGSSS